MLFRSGVGGLHMTVPTMSTLAHLDAMTDGRGLFEHARGVVPRREHGYCVDDNARLLLVTSRVADDPVAARLSRIALRLTVAALAPDGRSHNRMNTAGRWTDRPSTADCWGRNVWGLGVAATRHADEAVRVAARAGFDLAVGQRSSSRRAMAFAALGAADGDDGVRRSRRVRAVRGRSGCRALSVKVK